MVVELNEANADDMCITRNPRIGKVHRFLEAWRLGRKDCFPICCILRFAIQDALDDGKTIPFSSGQAVRRGGFYDHPQAKCVFIPCNIFHHQTIGYWEDYESRKSKAREKK